MNMLSGAFSNQKRAFDDPSPSTPSSRLGAVPAGTSTRSGLSAAEQAYAPAPKEPYRIRVLRPCICS